MKRVDLYRNLHRKGSQGEPVYSVRADGRVVDHVTAITLVGVVFVVSEAGRQRVIRDKRKNVHAFVRGCRDRDPRPASSAPVRVSYNPYRGPTFFRVDTGEAVESAHRVDVRPDGIFAWL